MTMDMEFLIIFNHHLLLEFLKIYFLPFSIITTIPQKGAEKK